MTVVIDANALVALIASEPDGPDGQDRETQEDAGADVPASEASDQERS